MPGSACKMRSPTVPKLAKVELRLNRKSSCLCAIIPDLFRRRADNGGFMAQRQEDFCRAQAQSKIFLSLRHNTAVVGATTKQIRDLADAMQTHFANTTAMRSPDLATSCRCVAVV